MRIKFQSIFRPDNVNENVTFDSQCSIPPSVHANFQTFAIYHH